jgi:hypothetical protein
MVIVKPAIRKHFPDGLLAGKRHGFWIACLLKNAMSLH